MGRFRSQSGTRDVPGRDETWRPSSRRRVRMAAGASPHAGASIFPQPVQELGRADGEQPKSLPTQYQLQVVEDRLVTGLHLTGKMFETAAVLAPFCANAAAGELRPVHLGAWSIRERSPQHGS